MSNETHHSGWTAKKSKDRFNKFVDIIRKNPNIKFEQFKQLKEFEQYGFNQSYFYKNIPKAKITIRTETLKPKEDNSSETSELVPEKGEDSKDKKGKTSKVLEHSFEKDKSSEDKEDKPSKVSESAPEKGEDSEGNHNDTPPSGLSREGKNKIKGGSDMSKEEQPKVDIDYEKLIKGIGNEVASIFTEQERRKEEERKREQERRRKEEERRQIEEQAKYVMKTREEIERIAEETKKALEKAKAKVNHKEEEIPPFDSKEYQDRIKSNVQKYATEETKKEIISILSPPPKKKEEKNPPEEKKPEKEKVKVEEKKNLI